MIESKFFEYEFTFPRQAVFGFRVIAPGFLKITLSDGCLESPIIVAYKPEHENTSCVKLEREYMVDRIVIESEKPMRGCSVNLIYDYRYDR